MRLVNACSDVSSARGAESACAATLSWAFSAFVDAVVVVVVASVVGAAFSVLKASAWAVAAAPTSSTLEVSTVLVFSAVWARSSFSRAATCALC